MIRLGRRALIGLVLTASAATLGDVENSKHDLSLSGSGSISSATESRICVFCHTPHNANPAIPLWNKQTSSAVYQTYDSTTLAVSTPLNQPTGSSKLCLSCHDGTVAIGQTVNNGLISLNGTGPGGRMPIGRSNLGIDLTDDHPISFARSPANPEVIDPPPGDAVALDDAGQVQCTSCHDAHEEDLDPISRRFLVKSNQGSAICLTCHNVDGWETNPSSHQASTATYTAVHGAHTGYGSVSDNGCESCHRPHSGLQPQRILKFVEEETCEACHNGSVASTNVTAQFNKVYSHPTFDVTPSVHDAAESPSNPSTTLPEIDPGASRHAECPDCHNPHGSLNQTASAPAVSGALRGTWGISSTGIRVDPAQFEYQVCYKCHGDSANKPQESGQPNPPYVARQRSQFNVRLEFDPSNPSHHAVEAAGQSNDVPSLLPPYTTASVLYCVDCHNNNAGPGAGGSEPNGPHGSTFSKLLERRYETGEPSPYSSDRYALCFKCHSSSSILNDTTFGEHDKHIRGEDASCSVCHDPHGISGTQGTATNHSRLINFDLGVVSPDGNGNLRFEDLGFRSGRCYLTCHGKEHNPESY